ncbi:MAG: ParB/RepB/Spo0J family partition protein [Elusimicrobia bacterium]|nr:ParB/RepB/Spo0J family partition protein [Elusimicrobiota bacterium]
MKEAVTPLQQIPPDNIRRNDNNPRLIFREEEMNQLLESIRKGGIKVPISVYPEGSGYTLIDGERRWRCAKKLNHATVPAIIQPKPAPLENLLMMFNIHNVRLDWDLMPMALKLVEIQKMLEKKGEPSTPKALAAITGVRLPTVERALELVELPQKFQTMLLKEAEKPKSEQKIKPDLFIEIFKSRRVVERYAPEVFEEVPKAQYVDALVGKYMSGVIDNVVGFRDISKIARAERAGGDRKEAIPAIVRLVKSRTYSIHHAFEDTVGRAYEQRSLLTRVRGLIEKLDQYKSGTRISVEVKDELKRLGSSIARLVG